MNRRGKVYKLPGDSWATHIARASVQSPYTYYIGFIRWSFVSSSGKISNIDNPYVSLSPSSMLLE